MGQMLDDVKMGVCGRFPVSLIHRTGGMIPTSIEVAQKAKQIYLDAQKA
jgi:2-oxoglutarate ferredoxin oxidoreductase subunit alpha